MIIPNGFHLFSLFKRATKVLARVDLGYLPAEVPVAMADLNYSPTEEVPAVV
jgi:hypothetical protein